MVAITEFLFFYCLLAVALALTVAVAVAITKDAIVAISLCGTCLSTAFALTTTVVANKLHSKKQESEFSRALTFFKWAL